MRGLLALFSLIFSGPAAAQQSDPLQTMVSAYYDCVRRSAKLQLPQAGDPSLAVEVALVACGSEERAIRAIAALNNLTPAMIDAVIARHQMAIKRELTAAPKR